MSSLMIPPRSRFFDANGEPLSGGKVYTYEAGTSTPLATYIDRDSGTPNTNPVELDADGYADIWLGDDSYKIILTDANDVPIWTVDDVDGLGKAIADQINVAGALAIVNNLSDLDDAEEAVENLGIAPWLAQITYAIGNGQSAGNLAGQTFDGAVITSVEFCAEIVQNFTIMALQYFSLLCINGTWTLVMGECKDAGTPHGVVFSVTQVGAVAQLRVAESGLGDGAIKIKKHYFFA